MDVARIRRSNGSVRAAFFGARFGAGLGAPGAGAGAGAGDGADRIVGGQSDADKYVSGGWP